MDTYQAWILYLYFFTTNPDGWAIRSFFCCCSLISICKHVLKFTFFGFFLSLTGDQQERKEMSFRHSVRANKKRGLVHPQLVHHQLPATNRQMALPILNPPQVCRKELLVDCPLAVQSRILVGKTVLWAFSSSKV